MFSDIFPEEELPPCEELTMEEVEDGVECSNDTSPAEPRYNDPIFERLFAQLWEDYQTTMNTNASLYGMYLLHTCLEIILEFNLVMIL